MSPRQVLGIGNFEDFHESISFEIEATHKRLRQLIGDANWGEDGRHRETVFRKILRQHLPESLHVGTGFASVKRAGNDPLERGTSTQIDILVTKRSHPALYQEGETKVVTADAVSAIIEVKTERGESDLRKDLATLANNGEALRRQCMGELWVGLIIANNQSTPEDGVFLEALVEAADGNPQRVINCIAVGSNRFFRFWPASENPANRAFSESAWHAYLFTRALAPSYFLSNCIDSCSGHIGSHNSFAWYPIPQSGGKEFHRIKAISFDGVFS